MSLEYWIGRKAPEGYPVPTYILTEADKKRLTEFIGKCWHEWKFWEYSRDISFVWMRCKKCGAKILESSIYQFHTFSTPDDRQALCEALMREGLWSSFRMYAIFAYDGDDLDIMDFAYWLLVSNPERACFLISDFLKNNT
jgi:hypothetical protein